MTKSNNTLLASPRGDMKAKLRNPFGIALMAYYLLMAGAGLLIPDDILVNHAWARGFSNFIAGIVPQIDRIAALNIKPDVNRLYFSVLWAGSPVLLVIVFGGVLSSLKQGTSPLLKKTIRHFSFPMTVVAFGCLAAWYVTWLVDSSMLLTKFAFGSPIGRSLIASSLALAPVFFGSILISWGVCWLAGYIPRSIEGNRNV